MKLHAIWMANAISEQKPAIMSLNTWNEITRIERIVCFWVFGCTEWKEKNLMVVIWILCNELNGGYSKVRTQKINPVLVQSLSIYLLFGTLAIIWLSFRSLLPNIFVAFSRNHRHSNKTIFFFTSYTYVRVWFAYLFICRTLSLLFFFALMHAF